MRAAAQRKGGIPMPDDRISLRQLLALLFAALLAPAIGVLPSQTAALAGEAGWLSALAALPVLLGLCWAVSYTHLTLPTILRV